MDVLEKMYNDDCKECLLLYCLFFFGFANTVYFAEIQHYEQQSSPTPTPALLGADHALQRVSSDAALLFWREIQE